MRIVVAVAIFSALTASCDPSAKTFGQSYDECLLKNASLEQSSASEICARHFERGRTFEERDGGLLTTTATLDAAVPGVPQFVRATVTNNSRRVIASSYEITVAFWTSPDSFTPDTFIATSKKWFYHRLEPGESADFEIPIEGGTAPSLHFTADATIWKVVPLTKE